MDAKEPRRREQRLGDDPGVPAAGEEMESAIRRLLAITGASFERRAQLERALETRIEIEQAKGILAERFRLGLDDAFELLRRTARRERRPVHDVAQAVIDEPGTPAGVLATLDGGRPAGRLA